MTKAEIQQVKLRFGIIGNTDSLVRAIDVAIQVAPTDLSVLITGESGVGKESFPQIIHQFSRRKHGQYIAVNCGAIPEGTIDSELFGHEKGAFTGAIGERKGYFGEADGGTIFLDEVGELPLPTQARLLRVLESGEFIKVGSSKVQKTDVRIVAATNVNLSNAIAEGRFREDLFYRLNTVPIQIPPLRERGDDVVLLFRKFASDFAEKYRMPAIQLTEDARKVLVAYSWPGNVRQLKNITEQISIIETERELDATILQQYLTPIQPKSTMLSTTESMESINERELMYKFLFDMKKDLTELKKLVVETRKEEEAKLVAAATAIIDKLKATPVTITAKAVNNVNKSIDALYSGIFLFDGMITSLRTINRSAAKIIPPKPAIKVRTTDSNKICPRICAGTAPKARRIPNSFVRSETVINKILAIAITPENNVIAPTTTAKNCIPFTNFIILPSISPRLNPPIA